MANVTYVALLRGVNVGKAKRIAMADLRALVGALGYRFVRTLLNSGNVVFAGPRAPTRGVAAGIEAAMSRELGVAARVTVLTAAELRAVAAANPLAKASANPSRLLVAVPARAADCEEVRPMLTRDWKPEAVALGRRAAYLWCPQGVSASRLVEEVERVMRGAVTMRNWATVLKLREMSADPAPE